MQDTIEALEDKKRRLELEQAIARLERKARASAFLSKLPARLYKALFAISALLAAAGTYVFLRGLLNEGSRPWASEIMVAGTAYWIPLLILCVWHHLRAKRASG